LLVFEAMDRGAVESFLRADPYQLNGVWDRVQIRAYVKRRGWASPTSAGI
jgi:uncharacterized protein YciI